MRRKEAGEAADVVSGRIFDSMAKPIDSPEYVYSLPNKWLQRRAHAGHVQEIVVCERRPQVILTLGVDVCVRMWNNDTGEAIGTLEQGLPEGLTYMSKSTWRFPIDAFEQVRLDTEAVAAACAATGGPTDASGPNSAAGKEANP